MSTAVPFRVKEHVRWYEVEQGYRDGLSRKWVKLPGWYSYTEAKRMAAGLRASGYAARLVKCEVVK